jgi:uncharacterized protein YcfJ
MISLAEGQSSDWHLVENLAPGTAISVVMRGRVGCDLVGVTDFELMCDRTIGQFTRRYVFKRADVREVRLELPEDNRSVRGAIVGAAAGGLLGILGGGQLADPEGRGYARIYGSPIGAFVGGAIGHAIHRHGYVVYTRR